MMRASFIPRSPLLMLAVALVAVAALFAGGAPAEAQSPATVTRTDSQGKTIEVRAGKYYTIGLTGDDGERITAGSGWIGEGNLGEFAVAVGEVPPAGGLAFICSTVADSAGAADYVGGSFPLNERSGGPGTIDGDPNQNPSGASIWRVNSEGEGGLQTLPIVTKSDYELEGDEYFWIECLPSRGSQKDEWQAWPSPRLRVRIVDDTTAVRFAQPAYTFTEGTSGTLQAIALSDYGAAGGEFGRQWDVTASVITSPTSLNGDARITDDYTVTPDSLAFARSREPKDISVTLADNDICEAPKTFTVRLAEPSGWQNDWGPNSGRSAGIVSDRDVYATLGSPATARVTIVDDGDKLDAPQGLRAELDGSTLKVSEWRRPPGCLANGVEMEYKLSTETSWTAGYKGGITWDYDGDGDPTNNNGLARDVSVDLGSAPAADAVYDVRVRLHNNATGGGKWAEATTVNESAEFTGLTVTSPDGSVTYELGRRQGSGFESGFEVSYYYVHVPPGLREVQVTVDWTATPEAGTSVGAGAKSYAFTGGPPKSPSARLTSSSGVALSKNTAGTVPLAATGGTDVYLGMTATFTSGFVITDEVRLVVLRNYAWESANNYLKGLRMSSGGSQPTYWPWPSWVNPQYTVENVVWAGPASPAGGRLSQWSVRPAPWAGTPAGLPQASGETLALTPAFDDEVYEYTARVPHNVALVTLHPVTDDPEASVTVNGKSPSTPVTLSVGKNVITVVVTAENGYQRTYTVTVTREFPNRPPAVASAIADATIINESGTLQVSLSEVFNDPDGDDLTITANSSSDGLATVSVSADHSTLTVTARGRGTAVIGVNANDGEGGEIWDLFFVKVKAAPVVAQPLGDVSELEVDATHEVSLSSVFSDPDGDRVTVTQASSSDTSIAAVSVTTNAATVTANSEGTATITVTARDADGNTVQDAFDVTVNAAAAQQQQVNHPPTVSSSIADATIANESGTHGVSLSGVFDDADGDDLTVTASSSDENTATVSVAADYSTLTVSAQARGTATVTVTAADGYGGSVEDSFTVRVKAAPVVASAISDVSGLEAGATRDLSLSAVFRDADGDSLTVSAASSDEGKATVSVAADGSTLTVSGVAEGTATITVTAQDSDGNSVSDAFQVEVVQVPEPEPEPVELPGPVVGLELTATHDSVSVSWSAPESGDAPDGYIVNIKRQGGGDGETRRPGANKTALTFRDLNGVSTYQVWVRAQNEAGKGERTHATITLPVELPGPVTGLEVAATEDGVTVSWRAPETGGAPDGYIVHIRPEGGAEGSGRTKTPRAKKTKVSFENLESGQTYKVWVRAQNAAGKGERVHASVTLP